jgi:Bardet-Biedl syndrome 5 protein
VEVVDTDRADYLAAYYADGGKALEREPVYCSDLGLAIENIKDGMTLDQLWNVV